MATSRKGSATFYLHPFDMLRLSVHQVPALKYAVGAGGIAAVVAIVLTIWKLDPRQAVIGGMVVFMAMVALVIFAALSRTGPRAMRPLAMVLAWSFLTIVVAVAALFVSCAFWDYPKPLGELFSGTTNPSDKGAVAQALVILEQLDRRAFSDVYKRLTPSVRENLPYSSFITAAKSELSQLPARPLDRRLKGAREQANFYFVSYAAEYDEASTWTETVTFVKTPSGWEFYRIDLQPESWLGASSTAKIVGDPSASGVISAIANGTPAAHYIGAWIPATGWRAAISSAGTKRAEHTCDLMLRSGTYNVTARNVLGGCAAKHQDVLVWAKITNATANTLELDQVRFKPAAP